MTGADLLAWGAAVYWVVAIGLLLMSVTGTVLQPHVTARRARRRDQPPVSIVLPVKLLDEGLERTQGSALAQRYPQFDVTVASAETDSPAVEKMRALLARHPEIPSRVLFSTARFAASPAASTLPRAEPS